jgi:CheY-like chemotaxis protein
MEYCGIEQETNGRMIAAQSRNQLTFKAGKEGTFQPTGRRWTDQDTSSRREVEGRVPEIIKASARGLRRHILFVDDEPLLRQILELYLHEKGFEVTTAASLEEGQTSIQTGAFDLAIIDVNLAGESGLDLVRLIKSKPQPMPVIVYTGLDVDEHLVERTLKGQADGILHKTKSLDTLLGMVRRHLQCAH